MGADGGRKDAETTRFCRISAWRDHGPLVAEAGWYGLRDVADTPAVDAVPPTLDHRFGFAKQAGRDARASWLYRAHVADLCEALGLRRCRSGLRRQRRPVSGAAHRSGHAFAFTRTDDCANRSAIG